MNPRKDVPKYKRQKNVLKKIDEFVATDTILKGATKPKIFRKKSKDKPFVVKSSVPAFYNLLGQPVGTQPIANKTAAEIKIKYDLYELLGMSVPKTYLLEEKKQAENGEQIDQLHLASKMEPGYKDLYNWTGKDQFPGESYYDSSMRKEIRARVFKEKKLNGKPIVGLFESLPIFAFLYDYDAIGTAFDNIGLIEREHDYMTVKIDPECVRLTNTLPALPDGTIAPYPFDELGKEHKDPNVQGEKIDKYLLWHLSFDNTFRRFTDVFDNIDPKDNLPALKKIFLLKNQDLHDVIYNKKIPDKYLSQEDRKKIYDDLIVRRNRFREAFIKRFSVEEQQKLQEEMKAISTQESSGEPAPIIQNKQDNNLFPLLENVPYQFSQQENLYVEKRNTSVYQDAVCVFHITDLNTFSLSDIKPGEEKIYGRSDFQSRAQQTISRKAFSIKRDPKTLKYQIQIHQNEYESLHPENIAAKNTWVDLPADNTMIPLGNELYLKRNGQNLTVGIIDEEKEKQLFFDLNMVDECPIQLRSTANPDINLGNIVTSSHHIMFEPSKDSTSSEMAFNIAQCNAHHGVIQKKICPDEIKNDSAKETVVYLLDFDGAMTAANTYGLDILSYMLTDQKLIQAMQKDHEDGKRIVIICASNRQDLMTALMNTAQLARRAYGLGPTTLKKFTDYLNKHGLPVEYCDYLVQDEVIHTNKAVRNTFDVLSQLESKIKNLSELEQKQFWDGIAATNTPDGMDENAFCNFVMDKMNQYGWNDFIRREDLAVDAMDILHESDPYNKNALIIHLMNHVKNQYGNSITVKFFDDNADVLRHATTEITAIPNEIRELEIYQKVRNNNEVTHLKTIVSPQKTAIDNGLSNVPVNVVTNPSLMQTRVGMFVPPLSDGLLLRHIEGILQLSPRGMTELYNELYVRLGPSMADTCQSCMEKILRSLNDLKQRQLLDGKNLSEQRRFLGLPIESKILSPILKALVEQEIITSDVSRMFNTLFNVDLLHQDQALPGQTKPGFAGSKM